MNNCIELQYSIPTMYSNKYTVIISRRIDSLLETFLQNLGESTSKIAIVYDEGVPKRYLEEVVDFVGKSISTKKYSLAGGEGVKTLDTLIELWRWFLQNNFSRGDLILAVGGGAVLDVVGLAASTYMRGLQWATIPTTLLAMIDAGLGGKTGINFEGAKNIIGSFYLPVFTIIDTTLVKYLGIEEYRSGLGEVVKYAVIRGGEFFELVNKNIDRLLKRDPDIIDSIVIESVKTKMKVVEKDPFETSGDRVVLNLGHTFGHIIEESIAGVKHGYAVSVGLVVEYIASAMFYERDLESVTEIIKILDKFSILKKEYIKNIDCYSISELIFFDKKRRGERYILVPLIYRIGNVKVEKLDLDLYSSLLVRACIEAKKVLRDDG